MLLVGVQVYLTEEQQIIQTHEIERERERVSGFGDRSGKALMLQS